MIICKDPLHSLKNIFLIKDQSSDDTQKFKESLNENHSVKYERKSVTPKSFEKLTFITSELK